LQGQARCGKDSTNLAAKLPFLKNVFSSFFNVCGFQVRARFFSVSVIFKAAQKSCSKQKQGQKYVVIQNKL